ncbi:hypothetical protein COO91_08047 [Nostoc flagelliforme CCNUN1]|uniref:Uncharacterized protein n=3 Tax=Nostoc flagelliforme TaxID=1306274 RepID=A0A2K8T2M9_9NOSO|nr:hypothetical protein COO91_08047 [Nostoc flagelliforme CCNUN1]
MPAAGGAIAGYTKALEFRNGKSFRRVTEEGYSASRYYAIQFLSLPPPSTAFSFEDVPHSCRKCCKHDGSEDNIVKSDAPFFAETIKEIEKILLKV